MSLAYNKTVVMELRDIRDLAEDIKETDNAEPWSRINQLCSDLNRIINAIENDTNNQSVDELRSSGHVVIVWTPEEIGEADTDILEEVSITRGADYLDSINGGNDEDERA